MVQYIGGQRGVIYLVTNKLTRKCYIGQTTMSLHERWRHHKRTRSEVGDCLGDDIGLLGESQFSIMELAVTQNPAELDGLETWYIQQYQTLAPAGYNLTPGGHSFSKTERSRDLQSRAAIGRKFTDSPKPIKGSLVIRCRKNKIVVDRKKPVVGTHLITGEVIELAGVSVDPRFDPRLVSACCKGKRRHHRGYAWRYKECPVA